MPITKVQQLQISGTLPARLDDQVLSVNLVKANRTLEDDLNSLRTQVRLIMGTERWYNSLSGSQDLADIYTAFRVTPSTGIANFQNNVYVTGSISGSGNFEVGGNITLQGNLDSDVNESKTLFGSVTSNTITIGGGGLVETAGDLKVAGNDIQASDGNTNITMTSNTLTEIKGNLQVTGNQIKSSDGNTAITLDNTNVIVAGDLTVNGTTTTIDTTNLEIKDSMIGLGFASGTIAQMTGDRGWIGGLSGSDNVVSFWDDSENEFAFATTANSATGSLPIPVTSYSNIRAAQISGSVVKASLGLSGSLTQLVDGTSYLVAGDNISITSASNGQVTIAGAGLASAAAQYLVLSADASLSNERVFAAGTGLLATDAGANGSYTLAINDSVVATVSGTTFQGTIAPSTSNSYDLGTTGANWYRGYIQQISGSHTQLIDGTSAFIAGTGISIVTGSNGAITISNAGLNTTAKGYLLGNDGNVDTGTGVVTFSGIGTLPMATDEYLDVYLNGVFLSYGYDITNITTTTFTLDSNLSSTLTGDDILAIILRDTV
jgi:hypothetical protein